MLATGIIDPATQTFDISGIQETNTSISTINGQLRFSYTSPDGKLVQLVKQLNSSSDNIAIGDSLGVSPATQGTQQGYGQRASNGPCKALTSVDWASPTVQTKTFVDDSNVQRVAALVPVVLG